MKRKIIQLAGNTLVVSLPSKWVKRYGVNKGDEIDLTELDRKILIETGKSGGCGEIAVDVSGRGVMLKRILGALYKGGYDEVQVNFSSLDELRQIQEVVREAFIGFEVIDQKKDKVVFRKVSHIEPKEFSAMVRRMFLIIISAGDDSLEALKKDDAEWLSAIALRDKDVNKISDFCRRVLNTAGTQEYKRVAPGYYMVEQVEKLGDVYRDIAVDLSSVVSDGDVNISPETLRLFAETNAYFRQFYEVYGKFDLEKVDDFCEQGFRLKKVFEEHFKKAPRDELKLLFNLQSIVGSTFDMNGALMAAHL
jgi:phosphate uptake regulator